MSGRNDLSRALGVLGLFVLLTLAWLWPMPTRMASRVAFDPGDPFLNTWILWWNAQAVPFTREWWDPPIFYPMKGALTLSEHLAGIGFFTTPIFALGGPAPLAYNVALLLSGALSGFFTWLFVRRLTGSELAAFCAGMAYAFAPFRAGQLSHLQVLTSQWLPLVLLGLHGYVESGRRAWLLLFGASWVLQSLSNAYYMLFTPVLIGVWVCWFVLARRRWRQALEIGAAWLVSSLALVPVVLEYYRQHQALGLSRSASEIRMFSGSFLSFLKPAPMLAFWPQLPVPAVEDFLFPGLTLTSIVAVGGVVMLRGSRTQHLRASPRATFWFYGCAALLMAALTLGPAAREDGALGWLKPYQWLSMLPGYDGIRVPVRFGMLMAFCLSVAGGIALGTLLPSAGRVRLAAAAVIIAGLWIDGAIKSLGGSSPPGRADLPDVPGAVVLELPPDNAPVSVAAMFRAMSHRLPLVNGYSGYIPEHYDILAQALRRRDPSAIIELARGRTLIVLVAERNDPTGHFRRLVESIPGVQRSITTSGGLSYIVPAQPREPRVHSSAVIPFTWTRLPREHVVVDFGEPQVVRGIEFALRNNYSRLGRRFAIEASLDGVDWTLEWDQFTGGAALAGALEDQVVVPVRLMLPDIRARYLRLHPAPDWLTESLRVLAP